MDNSKKRNGSQDKIGVSAYQYIDLLSDDPLEEIFELNMGNFVAEHLINPDLAQKIGQNVRDKNQNLKNQLRELISIYSIDKTLSLLGFKNDEEKIIYNSIAKTITKMLHLEYCNIYIAKKGEDLKLMGTSNENPPSEISQKIRDCWNKEKRYEYRFKEKQQILYFPMKNKFECIGTIEVARKLNNQLEESYCDLIKKTTGLFVTSLGLQKLIDRVQMVLDDNIVSTGELQNLRAQLTVLIGDLGAQQQSFVETLAYAADVKSKHNINHSKDTANLAKELCGFLGLNEKTKDLIYYAALLQNIGQISISQEIFNKKGKLTKKEWDELQNSPNAGVTILMNINFMSEVLPYVHYQKERWDGKGSPEGLGGISIPFGSRIISVADAFCALCEERPHRNALSKEEALEVIKSESGIKWDPTVVKALEQIIK